MQLKQAQNIAVGLCYKLQPFCDRLNIAGSIRRGKADVKDIEIVAQPKLVHVKSADLFGEGKTTALVNDAYKEAVLSSGKVIKGQPTGRYMQIALPEGVNLDLFMPAPSDYFRQYAIRTGDSQYSAIIIACGWIKLGWCGTEDGLRKIEECNKKSDNGKGRWVCDIPNPTLPPVWESEEAFFEWLKVPYKKPMYRRID